MSETKQKIFELVSATKDAFKEGYRSGHKKGYEEGKAGTPVKFDKNIHVDVAAYGYIEESDLAFLNNNADAGVFIRRVKPKEDPEVGGKKKYHFVKITPIGVE